MSSLNENKDDSLQRPCHQHTAVRQRDMDYVCQTGEKTKHLPPEKYSHAVSWAYHGKTKCPTPRFCLVCRLRCLGHVHRTNDGRIPKDIQYGVLASGKRTTGRPRLRYKDVCTRDMKVLDTDAASWEGLAADRTRWRSRLPWINTSKQWKRNRRTKQKTSGYAKGSAATPADQRPHTDATFLVESASPAWISSAIGDAAPAEQTVRTVRMLHPWSAMTEGAY